jgi:hypothetical protein
MALALSIAARIHARFPEKAERTFVSDVVLERQFVPGSRQTAASGSPESEAPETRQATLAVIRGAFEAAGVEFTDENGGGARAWA